MTAVRPMPVKRGRVVRIASSLPLTVVTRLSLHLPRGPLAPFSTLLARRVLSGCLF